MGEGLSGGSFGGEIIFSALKLAGSSQVPQRTSHEGIEEEKEQRNSGVGCIELVAELVLDESIEGEVTHLQEHNQMNREEIVSNEIGHIFSLF